VEEFKLQHPEKFNGDVKDYIKWVFNTNGLKTKHINDYCLGFQLIRVSVIDKKNMIKCLIDISAVGPVTDWYITKVNKLGGK
tara:strand:+ start:1209 stop:1454 length:246 start_codon:yes stop_codon:yes gene_type:complete